MLGKGLSRVRQGTPRAGRPRASKMGGWGLPPGLGTGYYRLDGHRGGGHQNSSPTCPNPRSVPACVTSLLTPISPTGTSAVTTGSELLFQAPGRAGSPWETFAVSPKWSGALHPGLLMGRTF